MRSLGFAPIFAILAVSCATGRTTTTERTALEQALLSQAAEATISQLEFGALAGRAYFLKQDFFEAPDGKYLLSLLHARLLSAGVPAASQEPEADVLIYPSVAYAGIDDNESLIGIPSFPIVVPWFGGFQLPEIALYRRLVQRGRVRVQVLAADAAGGGLAIEPMSASAQRSYDRWTLLFLLNFRLTDLERPF